MLTNIKQRISNLEQWLNVNSLEHEARPEMEARLKTAQEQYAQFNERPIERDTFDFINHQFSN